MKYLIMTTISIEHRISFVQSIHSVLRKVSTLNISNIDKVSLFIFLKYRNSIPFSTFVKM